MAEALKRITLIPSGPTRGRYRPPTAHFVSEMQNAFLAHSHSEEQSASDGILVLEPSALPSAVRTFLSACDDKLLGDEAIDQWFLGLDAINFHMTPQSVLQLFSAVPATSPSTSSSWMQWSGDS